MFTPSTIRTLLVIGLLLGSTPVLAQHGHGHHHEQQDASNLSELEALYWQRLEDSRQNFVQADVDFMTDMIVHHAQALIMSRLSPENGASPAVQRLSARIINAQQDEIALMQQWLRDRSQPVPIVHFDGIEMHVSMEQPQSAHSDMHAQHDANAHHHEADHASEGHENHHPENDHHHAHEHEQHTAHEPDHHVSHGHHGHGHEHGHNHDDMPGMLTQAQLEELAAARDAEFDRLFLTFMIEHHEGAVYMVNELFMADGAGTDLESYRLAVDIYAEQVTEIAMMRKMLERKGFDVPEPLRELQEQQARLRNPQAAGNEPHGHHAPETEPAPAQPQHRHHHH
ncbi:protein of unknown function (DUF305) [Cyclonatronum proteinivorum]|uniref:DUF305 domain-containing protein n=1 Tax=Cyclonatronum proteinivorum TaxID=1457365 RepID=A0A345UG54_9BACT|nr:DUF305 domain-containing protein [Cyclonatronum proteinivorum]AXI99455.1 protein of unknown function (DUF305) [Cyclonatronum proteinivorum]